MTSLEGLATRARDLTSLARPWPYGATAPEQIEEGVLFTDCPPAIYHADPAMSSGKLRRVALTPRHALRMPTSLDETPALVRGNILHCLILRPQDFDKEYLYVGSIDKRTAEGKSAWAAAEAKARERDLRIVRDQDMDRPMSQLVQIANEVRASREFETLLGDGSGVLTEVSYWWRDYATGILCRARADAVVIDPRHASALVIDLKTCGDASPHAIANALWYDHGDVQLAHYGDGLREILQSPNVDFGWLYVEVNESVAIAAHISGPLEPQYQAAFARRAILMGRWARAVSANEFPGWTAGAIAPVPLPHAAYGEIERETYGLGGAA